MAISGTALLSTGATTAGLIQIGAFVLANVLGTSRWFCYRATADRREGDWLLLTVGTSTVACFFVFDAIGFYPVYTAAGWGSATFTSRMYLYLLVIPAVWLQFRLNNASAPGRRE